MTAVQEFTEVFRAEHRQVRDLLLELTRAFGNRDIGRARTLIAAVAGATGPHFRHEEDIMVETLPGDVARRILSARRAALDAGLDLLTWAATARDRRA